MEKYKKLIEKCAETQSDWWLEQLEDNTSWMLDGEEIPDDDFYAVHNAIISATVQRILKDLQPKHDEQ